MKKASTSLVNMKNINLRPPWSSLSTQQHRSNEEWQAVPSAGKGMKQLALSHVAGRAPMVQALWETLWQFLIKLNIYPSYGPETPLLGICLQKWIHRATKILVQEHWVTLRIIAKNWNQPKCPSNRRWINQAWHFHPRNTSWQLKVISDTHNHVDESSKHDKGKKPDRKEYMRYESTYIRLKPRKN